MKKKTKEQPVTVEKVIDQAFKSHLFAETLPEERKTEKTECEFLSCEKQAEVFIEGFHLCLPHALKLIQSFTVKNP